MTTTTLTPASRKEQALWLLEQLAPGSGANNLSVVFEVAGRLGEWELQRALDVLTARHEVLRTVFHAADFGLVKRTLPADVPVLPVEVRELARSEVDAQAEALIARPFAFDGSPLLRAVLFRGERSDVLCLVVHHLVFDTISGAILLDELIETYGLVSEGLEPPGVRPASPVPASDDAGPAYWRERLRGFDPDGLRLSCGTPDVARPTLAGDSAFHELSPRAVRAVRALRTELRAPEAVVLLAAYYLLLARHGAGPDLVVGSPVDVRGPRAPRAIGYHVTTLPLRVRVDLADGFRPLVAAARETFLGAIAHADVPVDALLSEVGHRRDTWRDTVFRHGFNYVPDVGEESFEIDGTPARRLFFENGCSKLDLEFFFVSARDGIRIRGAHSTEVLSATDVRLLLQRYDALLAGLGEDPDRPVGELPLFGPEDVAVIEAANDTARDLPHPALPQAIARQVRATPGAVAVVDGDRRVTYAALWRAAVAVGDVVRGAGARPGDVVALAGPRGPELAAAAIGVWLAGCAYLPLDPDHPRRRTADVLRDSGARTVLAAPGVDVPADPDVVVRAMPPVVAGAGEVVVDEPVTDPDEPALLIYTSGSTGAPKGTVITHRGEANVVQHHVHELGAGPADATLWLVPFTFDPSGIELFLPLVSGGRIVVAPDAARTDPLVLADLVEAHGVGIVQATPTTWRTAVERVGDRLRGLRVVAGGEPLPLAVARRLTAAGCELRNAYGPSETTICSTMRLVPPDAAAVDVGRPIFNTTAFVVDPEGRELPIGVVGELCIAGAGVSAGYRGRPELTAERFGTHPAHGRFYRTGDLASWLPDGGIALHGRLDRQVKVRGNRVELDEVEAALTGHPSVRAAAVVVVEEEGEQVLRAFVVADENGEQASGEADESGGLVDRLWEHASRLLPRAAVPQDFVLLDALPLTANHKVDHQALRRADRPTRALPDDHLGDELVAGLVRLWRDLLDRADVDAHSNFFAHGGQSLLGVRLMQRVEDSFGAGLPLAELFANPTPARLATRLRRAVG
ncbi:amino acid adenylation domain-containing protein [Saccharothrix sp. HUAS TT1]|uniref:non-ribosomal peptide synthetase n=1 Tax=unclassified Saccharothrix TaxID=2593673 RepID=UPI00345C524A